MWRRAPARACQPGRARGDDLTVQLIGIQGFESGYTLLMPRVTYRFWERLEARAGYLFIAGSESTVIGQYKNNDEAFV